MFLKTYIVYGASGYMNVKPGRLEGQGERKKNVEQQKNIEDEMGGYNYK